MPTDSLNSAGFGVRGHVTIWRIDENTGLSTPLAEKDNQIQVSWGHIAAKQLGYRRQPDRDDYMISSMYFEYENQTNPALPVTVSTFDRLLGPSYYRGLASSFARDFIRAPLRLEPALSVAAGSLGEATLRANQQGNQLTFFAQTAGTTGVNGKSFSHLANSKVYSAALVATPKFDDWSRDVIFARINFDVGDQTSKEASSQIGITWDIVFE
jgi:hypothetical protein